jgi:hypothetical protein
VKKRFSEPGKKQLLNAHLHSLASNHCEDSREVKNPKKKKKPKHKNTKSVRKFAAEKKRKRKEKLGEAQGFNEGSSASGHPTSLFQISPHPFPFRRRAAREKSWLHLNR